MASFRRRGRRWVAQVCVDGRRPSRTFDTKGEAAAWAARIEAELAGKPAAVAGRTLRDACESYMEAVAPSHRGERWERVRLLMLMRIWPRVDAPLAGLLAEDLVGLRDLRLRQVSASSVVRELALIRSVLEHARLDLRWIPENPMREVRLPKTPPARRRRVPDDEIAAMLVALGYRPPERPVTMKQQVAVAFLLAIETAMRAGEILGLRWADVREKSVRLPRTKNGDSRDVPLSPTARALLDAMPREGPGVFSVTPASRDALWRKARAAAASCCPSVEGLHFHDSRAEAIWRLSKKLGVLDLARVIGHRDPRSLMLYYNASADELADLL